MVKLTPAQAFVRVTSKEVIAKPDDLNMFDDKMHIFKAGWTETRTSEFLKALQDKHKDVKGIDRHEVVIVGKGKAVDAETPEPIFIGKDLSIFEGGGETRLSDSSFDQIHREADITYIGLTSKSHNEISSIGSYSAKRKIALTLTKLFSKRECGKRNTGSSMNTTTVNHSFCISWQRSLTNDHTSHSRSKGYVKSFRE
ncbi:hypothetical protein MMC27_002835 [Xylographa pallens]|nr:hypothetical protein [Xylographa pallens]